MAESLEGFFEASYPARRAMIAWLDQQGLLQPIVARWSGTVPQLPARTFSELDLGDRVAVLRGAGPDLLIYPVPAGSADSRVYLLAETNEDDIDDDRILLAELASMLASHWTDFAGSSVLLGRWEAEARSRVEERLPGTSLVIRTLRDEVVAAARSAEPVLLYGRAGSGRAYLGSLIASLRPTGRPWIRVIQVRGGDDHVVASELFGSGHGCRCSRDLQNMPVAAWLWCGASTGCLPSCSGKPPPPSATISDRVMVRRSVGFSPRTRPVFRVRRTQRLTTTCSDSCGTT